jgi:hypothetical protein
MSRDVRAGPTESPPSAWRPGPHPKMMIPLPKPKDEEGATNPVLLSKVQTANVPAPPTPKSQSAYGSHTKTRSQGNIQNTLFWLATIFMSRSSWTAHHSAPASKRQGAPSSPGPSSRVSPTHSSVFEPAADNTIKSSSTLASPLTSHLHCTPTSPYTSQRHSTTRSSRYVRMA